MQKHDNKLVFTYFSNVDKNAWDPDHGYFHPTINIYTSDSERAGYHSLGSHVLTITAQGHTHRSNGRIVQMPYAWRIKDIEVNSWGMRQVQLKKVLNALIKADISSYKDMYRLFKKLRIKRVVMHELPPNGNGYKKTVWIPHEFRHMADAYVHAIDNGLKVLSPTHPFHKPANRLSA